jgi:gliding motility-associated-like protein
MPSKQSNYKTMKKAFSLSKNIVVTLLYACLSIYSFGQQTRNYINNWYLGDAVGISFNTGAAVNVMSAIDAYEATTSYSDGAGNTLFYAGANNLTTGGNGFTVWDASHNTMPNADISIDYSSSCGLVTAPVPGNCDQFYVFHLSSTGPGWGVYASLIDMTLPGNGTGGSPLGDVVPGFKDSLIYGGDNLAEKLKIVQQGNTENYWLIARSMTADIFYTFEVSASGITVIPIVSTISATTFPSAPMPSPITGWLAVNKSRTLIAEASGLVPNAVLYNFDNNTGVLSLSELLMSGTFGVDIPHGVEFSPSGTVLYVNWLEGSNNSYISSFDMTVGSPGIAATRQDFLIASAGNQSGALVKAPDGNIYGIRGFTSQLTVITTPENYLTPTILNPGFNPAPGVSEFGLPNNTYYYHPDNFIDTLAGNDRTGSCSTYQTEIGAIGYDSIWAEYSWSPTAMLVGSSSEATPQTINLSADQEYILHVIHECGDTIKSDTVMVTVGAPLVVTLTTNSPICENQLLSLSAFPSGLSAGSYSWIGPNGPFGGAGLSTVDIIPIGNPIAGGWYYVTVDDGACAGVDSAFVISNSTYNIFDTIAICSGTNYTYADGAISNNIIVDESHISSLTTAVSCDSIVREFLVVGTNAAPVIVTPNSWYCVGDNIADLITATGDIWYNGPLLATQVGTGASFTPPSAVGVTNYYVVDTTGGCFSLPDSIAIEFVNCITCVGNLVPNPSFETNTGLPSTLGQYNLVDNWSNSGGPTAFSADYFHTNGIGVAQLPTTSLLTSMPKSGNATMGAIIYSFASNYREYINVQLTSPLIAGATYDVSFYVTAGNFNGNAGGTGANNIGAHFSVGAITQPAGSAPFNIVPVFNYNTVFYDSNWVQMSFQYTATTPIDFLTVGNFYDDAGTTAIIYDPLSSGFNQAIIMYDDFCVTAVSMPLTSIGDTTICSNDSITLWATGSTSYNWADSTNITTVLSADSFYVVSPIITTTYAVYNATDTVYTTVTVELPGDAGIDALVNLCSSGLPVNLYDSLGGTPDVTGIWGPILIGGHLGSFDPQTNLAGNYEYIITSTGACPSDTSEVIITITAAPNTGTNGTISFCSADPAADLFTQLGPGADLGGVWSSVMTSGTGVFDPATDAAGTYTYTLTNSCGTSSNDVVVTVNLCTTPVSGYAVSDTAFCEGTCITITDASTSGDTWEWTFNGGTPAISIIQNPGTVCFNAAGIYTIEQIVTNSFGSDTTTSTVEVFPLPIIDTGAGVTLELGGSTTLNATGGGANAVYTWNPADWLTCIECSTPIATPEETITYTVSVVDSSGCLVTNDVTIIVNYDNVVWAPNIFSANGDGLNDVFYVRGPIHPENFTMIIYSRWGEKIFETTDPTFGWDGTFSGKPLNTAVFAYLAIGSTLGGAEFELKGNITLIVK